MPSIAAMPQSVKPNACGLVLATSGPYSQGPACLEGTRRSCSAAAGNAAVWHQTQGLEPAYLEELTGLAALQQAMQQYEASLEDCAADGEAKEKEGGVERDAEAEGSESGDEWTSLGRVYRDEETWQGATDKNSKGSLNMQ
eukprot:scaffold196488_cov20-Tisochrysis_lutea.AAC.1